MRRPVRVGLVVVAVRPEGKAVLHRVARPQRTCVRPAPDSGGEHAPVCISKDEGEAVARTALTTTRAMGLTDSMFSSKKASTSILDTEADSHIIKTGSVDLHGDHHLPVMDPLSRRVVLVRGGFSNTYF